MKGEEKIIGTLEGLESLALRLVGELKPNAIISISGDLGAGKTTFCQALLRALGYKGEVTSPTFALHHVYFAPGRRVDHFDLYRVEKGDQAFWSFFDEILCETDLALIEWPEHYPFSFPAGLIELKITIAEDGARHYHWRINEYHRF
jgi:tRNA threonylcarbamoyladenosine biosynthesis protein TsaE